MKKTKNKKSINNSYVFIDATNIIYGASRLGWKVDFQKLFKYLKERYKANKIFYFAGVDDENKKQLKFYEKLSEFGYLLRLIPVKRFSDGSRKADVDSRMTFEIMLNFPNYNCAVVMTGDGDFYWVLDYLVSKKQKIYLMSQGKSTARELKKLFGKEYTDVFRIKNLLEFKQKKRGRRF